ncbi:growth hormone-inducible transmembrane protein-like [Vespa mandarinia]|uniref:growth hormone-inducible transmembrane protein-like n=1 Tax=Vespa mandarinia TaxID=7446 RepID=UPI001622B5E9|nr:growth hormone-inducible transmembrane protein-like [Vespa mandarinia]XP_035726705.1 growth hormone-inducible transmembrane protein-like [Vespa mandarinia]XP_035726706.1 growth hormone-inducible transmembrane protein-like [Vespa mandarinia]
MMLARVCRVGLSPTLVSFIKTPIVPKPMLTKIQPSRLFANDGRTAFTRTARRNQTVAEKLAQPATETPFNVGKIILAGASAFGLGSLCYYGLGLDSRAGAIDQMHFWPQYVKERIRTTYMYFGGSVIITAASAALCLRSPAMMNLVTRQGWLAIIGTMMAMIGSGIVAQSIPYKEGLGIKQLAWMVHAGIIGAVIAPICLMGGPLLMRAALYTSGVIGGLSTVAMCAPSDKFLKMAGPLSIGLGVVFVSSLGTLFLPPTTAIGASLYSLSIYGGLILFSMFLLYDTQNIIKDAQVYPVYHDKSIRPYDPIKNAISIYLDTLNIFLRILTILSNGGSNRRK